MYLEAMWKSSNKNYNKNYVIKISSIYPMLLFARDLAVSQHTSEIMLLYCGIDKSHSARDMSGLGSSLVPLGFVPSQFLYLWNDVGCRPNWWLSEWVNVRSQWMVHGGNSVIFASFWFEARAWSQDSLPVILKSGVILSLLVLDSFYNTEFGSVECKMFLWKTSLLNTTWNTVDLLLLVGVSGCWGTGPCCVWTSFCSNCFWCF